MNVPSGVRQVCLLGLGIVLAGCATAASPGTVAPPVATPSAASATARTSGTPTAIPSPAQSAVAPGPYRLESAGVVGSPPASISVSVPTGWTAEGFAVGRDGMKVEPALGVWQINNRFNHPCTDHTLLSPPPGPGVDHLIDALASQPGIHARPITDATIDGYRGKAVELTVATEIMTCGNGDEGFWLWASPDGDHRYVANSTEMDRIYALDVDGTRFTFFARIPAGTTAADLAALEGIIDSIDIEPMAVP